MPGPIRPEDATRDLPEGVYTCFNTLIRKHLIDGKANFTLSEAADLIAQHMGCSRVEVYDNKWCDVEDTYRAVGWDVTFDKPAYNENYAANFTFKKKRHG
jgi:hypothetical protein